MGYLDTSGLTHFWGTIKAALRGKQDQLTPDSSITLEGTDISVALPTKAITQAEYDALPEEEKRNGILYLTPGATPDTGSSPVPTGAVISFLALSAPDGYLICDGTEHPIAKFPGLSRYIEAQFGAVNHFGGDGETTFAVPDMRNLFLRGYHGDAEEPLSGEIGEKQKGTEHIGIVANSVAYDFGFSDGDKLVAVNIDSYKGYSDRYILGRLTGGITQSTAGSRYTARPVNMAVLYCIKI